MSYFGDYSDLTNDPGALDSYVSDNSSGTVAYNYDTTTQATGGGVINSSANPLTSVPDASGGNGSFLSTLQNVLTQGLSDATISATEFGLGSLTDRLNVNANARITQAAQQAVVLKTNTTRLVYGGLFVLAAIFLLGLQKS